MASDPVNHRSVDALSNQIDVVRARLSSLNSNLGHSSIDRMAAADFGNNSSNAYASGVNYHNQHNNSADFGSPPPLTTGAHKRYKGLLDKSVGGATSSSPVPPPSASAERTTFDAGTSVQHQRQVAAAHADSRWQMQQDMLSRQLDEFRRGGGELDAATPFEAAAAAGAGGGRNLDAFADMQKRLRSKLTAMGTGALSPAPGVDAQRRREIEEDEARQFEAEQRRQQQQQRQTASPESPRNAAPPRPAGIPVQSTSGRSASDIGLAGDEVMMANRASHADPAGGANNMREAYAGANGQVRGGGGAQALQTAGRFQSPSLIGGLVGRFNQRGNDTGASDAEPNAGASPRSGTPARRASSSATAAATHGGTASPASAVAPSAPPPQQHSASVVGSQEVDLSGAEVFAILRMRGIVVSRGQTGEHLLPAATCHRMALSAAELQQLNQLRESLRRQARNSPRGASAAGRASPRASTPSLRSTEAAMAVAEPTTARTRTTATVRRTATPTAGAQAAARRTAATSRSAVSPAASSRATAARHSGTPSDAAASPARQQSRWR